MSTETENLETLPSTAAETEPRQEETPKEDAELDSEPEENPREELEWTGVKGPAQMDLEFFSIVGLPETLDDETDPTHRIILALIAEVQRLRARSVEVEAAVKYLALGEHLKNSGKKIRGVGRGAPMGILGG